MKEVIKKRFFVIGRFRNTLTSEYAKKCISDNDYWCDSFNNMEGAVKQLHAPKYDDCDYKIMFEDGDGNLWREFNTGWVLYENETDFWALVNHKPTNNFIDMTKEEIETYYKFA